MVPLVAYQYYQYQQYDRIINLYQNIFWGLLKNRHRFQVLRERIRCILLFGTIEAKKNFTNSFDFLKSYKTHIKKKKTKFEIVEIVKFLQVKIFIRSKKNFTISIKLLIMKTLRSAIVQKILTAKKKCGKASAASSIYKTLLQLDIIYIYNQCFIHTLDMYTSSDIYTCCKL